MNLRRQLLFVSLLTFVLPWAGCEFIRETEKALRESQQQMLAGTARAFAESLAAFPEEFPARLEPDHLYGDQLYSHDLEQAPVIDGYLDDISESETGHQATLRSGETYDIAPGTIVVNCTGSFFRGAYGTDAPCLSPGGAVVHINARDGFHFLTSVSGFFLMHLLYRDELRGQGFYSVDHEALFRKNRNAWVGAAAAQAYMNQTIAVQTLPLLLLDKCGLDLDRWYPLPRRMAGLFRMKRNATVDIANCKKTLDRVAERFDVRCEPLA